jgi:hypothetical protein
LARITKNAVWIKVVLEPFQTSRIVWEHFLEVFFGEPKHLGFAVAHGYLP